MQKSMFHIHRVRQKISNTIWAMLQNSWKCTLICIPWILKLFNKVEKCYELGLSVCLSVRPSVYALTLLNIL